MDANAVTARVLVVDLRDPAIVEAFAGIIRTGVTPNVLHT